MQASFLSVVILPYVVIVLLALLSRYVPYSALRFVLWVLFAALIAMEVGKQYDAFTAEGGYPMWKAPLHFSSTFYISIGLSLFGGRCLKKIGSTVLFAGGFFLVVIMLISPKSIFGVAPQDVFSSSDSLHGWFFHMAILLYLAVMIANGWYEPELKDPLIFAVFTLIYACIAAPVALKTGTNFCGLVTSYISILESFRQANGQAAYLIVYYLYACVLASVCIYVYYCIRRLYAKLCAKGIKKLPLAFQKNILLFKL